MSPVRLNEFTQNAKQNDQCDRPDKNLLKMRQKTTSETG